MIEKYLVSNNKTEKKKVMIKKLKILNNTLVIINVSTLNCIKKYLFESELMIVRYYNNGPIQIKEQI